jgi:hypothetical protein
LGGRIVGPHGTISIPVRAGAHTVLAAYINPAGRNAVTGNDATSANVSVGRGQTTAVRVSGQVGAAPTVNGP